MHRRREYISKTTETYQWRFIPLKWINQHKISTYISTHFITLLIFNSFTGAPALYMLTMLEHGDVVA